jgi:hypothetical protein
MTKARLLEKLDAEVERWNRDHAVGARVKLEPFYDELPIAWEHKAAALARADHTTSAAFIHGVVSLVYVNGLTVAVPLDWCLPC